MRTCFSSGAAPLVGASCNCSLYMCVSGMLLTVGEHTRRECPPVGGWSARCETARIGPIGWRAPRRWRSQNRVGERGCIGSTKNHLCAPDASSDVRSLIRNTSSVGDHGRSPLLPMLRDGRSQQIAFAPDAPHQEITADRLCSRCSRISVLMEMREQICSRSILLCILSPRSAIGAPRAP